MNARLSDDRGSGLVAGIVFMFAFTFLGLIWLAGTVDRGISNQSAATSIAFQAARSGAQAALPDEIRGGDVANLDAGQAQAAANETAATLISSYRLSGNASISSFAIRGTTVIVEITITDGTQTVRGRGAAEAVEVT